MWQARIRAQAQEALFQWVLTLESLWIQHELPRDIRKYLFRIMVPVAPKGDPDLLENRYVTAQSGAIWYSTRYYQVPIKGFPLRHFNNRTVLCLATGDVAVCSLCLKPANLGMCYECVKAHIDASI